ncbi:MAG: N-acetylglucosamine-6-phosphate deacetylase [Cetobacterium sp.]|uniref:N-acetylglucosamine-6-phosphate deacetylase n=2 Tax=Fusobacteriaceae TaxID=203492 RepID=UPI001F059E67|nr:MULTISPECIES: N-acetylglucosamine-6-phosphate deacetylase [Cetobacterium]MCX3065921.1 N-acetylglucosamine-6-phosphate deacetylase [Cetobacterium somerae]UPO98065.1 N-acetylglucosamine-6-phosphate deacetylase [Cetobacterium somerae]
MKAIINGELFIGNKFYTGKVLIMDGERIVDIIPQEELITTYGNIETIDAENAYVTPGFIDLQLNGCGGVLFNDDISLETLDTMHKTNLKYGCTSFTPTLITTGDESIEKAIELVKGIENKGKYGVVGLHIEGPYISLQKKGIHNPKFIRKADEAMIDKMIEAGKENVRIVTLAPENTDKKIISKLNAAGIHVAVGHSNASYEQVKEKEGFGITLATHLYNGMSSFNHREPGVVGAVFDSDIKAGVIADGFHCHYSAIKSAIKIMGERLYLVTDAVAPVGTDMEYFYFEGNKVFYKDGKCFGEDGTLGGSALTMDAGVRNLVKYCDITLEEAVRMATLYPAKAVNIDNEYGKLQPGCFADIVFLDKHLRLKKVIAKGELV